MKKEEVIAGCVKRTLQSWLAICSSLTIPRL